MDEDGLVAQRGQRRKRAEKPALLFHDFGESAQFDTRLEALWATDRRRVTTTLSVDALRRLDTADPSELLQVEQINYPITNLCRAFVNKNIKVSAFPIYEYSYTTCTSM